MAMISMMIVVTRYLELVYALTDLLDQTSIQIVWPALFGIEIPMTMYPWAVYAL